MAENTGQRTVREAVGVFDDAQSLEAAVDELESSGFDRADLSLLATEKAVIEKLGHRFERVSELEDDAKVPREAFTATESLGDAEGGLIGGLTYVGAVAAAGAMVAAGGTLAGVIAATAMSGGAGGLIGSVLARLIDDRHAERIQQQLGHGGLLLWVRTWTPEQEERAKGILDRHTAHDVHIHELPSVTG